MITRPPLTNSAYNRSRHAVRSAAGWVIRRVWDAAADVASLGPKTPGSSKFGSFGDGTIICFPFGSHVNARHIHLGESTMIAPGVVLSAGWGPGHPGLPDVVVRIGDRCLIGRGSSVIGHQLIEIGNDVWTGYDVRIADMNHGYEDVEQPISGQWQAMDPIRIGDGSWLGHHVVVLPGVTIGKHVTVGAGSVVTEDLPDYSVAVGVPARVIRQWSPECGWQKAETEALESPSSGD
jgi:acetyltransferase-like isoleucine patch superfamily enzyme